MYAYSNNGLSFQWHDADYVAQAGEVLFGALATPTELTAAFSGYAAASATSARQPLQASAQAALDKSDITVIRCAAAQPPVPVPTDLTTYRAALRAIVNGSDTTSTILPSAPPFPEGT